MGSIGDNGEGGSYVYRSSKAALNAVIKSLSIDLAVRGVTAVAFHPGWVSTAWAGVIEAADAGRQRPLHQLRRFGNSLVGRAPLRPIPRISDKGP